MFANQLMPVLMDASWTLDTFLKKLENSGKGWITGIFIIIGLVMVLAGVYKAAKKLMQGQAGGQTSWVTIALLIAVGAALTTIGVNGVIGLGEGAVETIKGLGGT